MARALGPDHWVRWHDAYADPDSDHSLRLQVVQAQIRAALDEAAPGAVRVLSLCAGQGRDLLEVLRDHPRASDVRARLVELDPTNVEVARAAADAIDMSDRIEVLQSDAGSTDACIGATPADLLLLVGVFGNIADGDIARTVRATAMLCRTGGVTIWTRHRRPPDLTPTIRAWFVRSGCRELSFVAPADRLFSVGTVRFVGAEAPLVAGRRLFTFDRTGS